MEKLLLDPLEKAKGFMEGMFGQTLSDNGIESNI